MLPQLLGIANVAVQNGLEGLVALSCLYLILYLLGSDDYLTPAPMPSLAGFIKTPTQSHQYWQRRGMSNLRVRAGQYLTAY